MHNALIPLAKKEDIVAVDQFSREARQEIALAVREQNQMSLALMTARAVQGLRELVTPAMMTDVMALMNTQVGFDTDRNPAKPGKNGPTQPYAVEVVKDCFITAQLWGASPINNEFNILAGRTYRTVNFYRRKVREMPGVTDVSVQVSTPEYAQVGDGKAARVACVGTWRQDGKQRRVACLKDSTGDWRISVKCNAYMGDDGVKGKAERKLLALMLADMSGCPVDDDMTDHDDTIPQSAAAPVDSRPAEDAEFERKPAENPGDDIAADAEEALREHTPASSPQSADNPDRQRWLDGLAKKPNAKAAAAWAKAAHDAGIDILPEADQFIKDLAARKSAAA